MAGLQRNGGRTWRRSGQQAARMVGAGLARLSARCRGRAIGYIGCHRIQNLGDDAMLEAARALLPGRVTTYHAAHWEDRLRHVGMSGPAMFRWVVLGGGTLINDEWYEQVRAAQQQGLALWSFGTGVGSSGFEQPLDVDLSPWAPLLREFAGLGVRGKLSQRKLAALGVDHAEVVGDPALVLAQSRTQSPTDPPTVAVNVSLPRADEAQSGEQAKLREVEASLRELLDAGWDICPIAMYRRDLPSMHALLDAVGQSGRTVHLPRTASAFFELVARCRFTVAVRLHTAILSTCVGVPPLILGYREKGADFADSMDMMNWHVDFTDRAGGAVEGVVRELAEADEACRESVLQRAQAWRGTFRDYVQRMLSEVAGE